MASLGALAGLFILEDFIMSVSLLDSVAVCQDAVYIFNTLAQEQC